ncbi:MAG: DUF3793 family protein [Oscillospiraceae bacterium]|nr:DUF3793 family protein [Oscillospiraceae bacterium]
MKIEYLLAYHCGPALAGIKTANIMACGKKENPKAKEEINRLNGIMNERGIYFEILCECEKRVLIMAYRREKLSEYLNTPPIKEFLVNCGYPESFSLSEYLDILRERLREKDFPHEIGAFLGYPIHDIYGFINHKDEGCLLTGEWKVYADADSAEKLFCRYRSCRMAILRHMMEGKTLEQLFCAA